MQDQFILKIKINNSKNSEIKEVKCYDNLNYDSLLSKSNEINLVTLKYLNKLDKKVNTLLNKFMI